MCFLLLLLLLSKCFADKIAFTILHQYLVYQFSVMIFFSISNVEVPMIGVIIQQILLLLLLLFMMMLLQLQSRTHIFFFALWEYHMRTHRHQWQPSSYDRYICYASIVQLQMQNLDKYIAVDELMNASFYHTIVQSPKLIDSIEN